MRIKKRNWTMAFVSGALAVLILPGGARSQTAEPAPAAQAPAANGTPAPAIKKAKPKAEASTVGVTVINSRMAGLIKLEAAATGSGEMKKVAGPLKPGKQVSAQLPRGKDCQVDLRGSFDDGRQMEATGFDACANKTLNLTE